jgi:predicted amidohydrolase
MISFNALFEGVSKMSFKVALLQLLPEKTTAENLTKGVEYCRRAKASNADLALFPEMWSVGYQIPKDIEQFNASAVAQNGEFVSAFGALAKELDMAIGITFLEQCEPLPRNTMCVFDRFGTCLLSYAKVHTCDFDDEKLLTPGNDFYVADLNTAKGVVKIGAMICYDREFPESARILMLKGAEIILVPNACPMEINRISQLRGRAYENMVGIATANYPAGQPDCNGHSTAFDGIAYKALGNDEFVGRDTLILEADEREGIYIADFAMNDIREYRQREVHGNAYRHPQKYRLLIAEDIREPFIRNDYRK